MVHRTLIRELGIGRGVRAVGRVVVGYRAESPSRANRRRKKTTSFADFLAELERPVMMMNYSCEPPPC